MMSLKEKKLKRHISPFQLIILGFLGLIAVGTALLMMPLAARDGVGASFGDAAFTATSAACVTGLVVQDTATYWSFWGQAIILVLIQIGGMGVVTAAAVLSAIAGRRIGLAQRSVMQEAISAPQIGGIVRITKFSVKMMASIETLGAILLIVPFCREFGALRGAWYAVFHSVSSFCNAGFDLMGVKEHFSSLVSYAGHPVVNITVMLLIISGGIGFMTWDDIRTRGVHIRRYRMQSKVILTMTGLLILLPAVWFFFCEFSGLPAGQRTLASLFQSVTTRTAGFNTVDVSAMSQTGQMLMIMLMLVGGAPGSTAGGMKITTAAVIVASAAAVFRHRSNAEFFGRRISNEAVRQASAVMLLYILLPVSGAMLIAFHEGVPFMSALFETASAVGTVGISLGLTPHLGALSHAILMFLMFFGRAGCLTMIYAAFSQKNTECSRYPEEKIMIG